jgi:dTDP-4-amino-4,6-dideoxygalactose transaminase
LSALASEQLEYALRVIRLARPVIGDAEIGASAEVLRSGMLVQGERVAAFERALAERCGREHAIAVGSGTAALILALRALDVRGDVSCPNLSWPSPAHAILAVGARPVLVDVDPRHWTATVEGTAIAIDQFGMPSRHDRMKPLIVDAACAIGSTFRGRPSASFGVIACLSFHPRKLVTTGEGGACVTDDGALANELRILRNHGQRAAGEFMRASGNDRMSEIAAAIGLAQLARLDEMIDRRRALAARYRSELSLEVQLPHEGAESNWQTFGAVLPGSIDRDVLIAEMRRRGVEIGRLSYALHRLPSLAGHGGRGFEVSERLDRHGIALPLHPLLTDAEQDTVLSELDAVLRTMGAP